MYYGPVNALYHNTAECNRLNGTEPQTLYHDRAIARLLCWSYTVLESSFQVCEVSDGRPMGAEAYTKNYLIDAIQLFSFIARQIPLDLFFPRFSNHPNTRF